MDGLSVATSVLALLDAAIKLKDSIDKVGQNRQRLRDLARDLVRELTRLQRFCAAHEFDLRGTPELDESLEDVRRDLRQALTDCEKAFQPGRTGLVGRMQGAFREWRDADDIEAKLGRLKGDIQSSILWACLYGVARSEMALASREHEILVSRSDSQWRMQRFDASFGEAICHPRSQELTMLLGYREPRDVDRRYLRFKVQSIAQSLESLRVSSTGDASFIFTLSDYIPSAPSHSTEVTAVISSTVQVWEVIRSLHSDSNVSFAHNWLQPSLGLADTILTYGFGDLSYRIFRSGVRILREVVRRAPDNCERTDTLLLFYTWALMRQAVMCTNGIEKLEIIWTMVDVRSRLYHSMSAAYPKAQRLVWLCRALTELASTYYWIGDVDDATTCCERALRLTHPLNYDDNSSAADWTELEAFTTKESPWTIGLGNSHPVTQALAYGLLLYAKLLHAQGHYGGAWHAGQNAIRVIQSLHSHASELPGNFYFFDWHMKWLRGNMPSWVEVVRNPRCEDDEEYYYTRLDGTVNRRRRRLDNVSAGRAI